MNKSTVSKSFNTLFFEFLDDVISIYPENKEIKYARERFELIRKGNPTIIIKFWNIHVYKAFKEQIDSGDISYFLNKDYKELLQSADETDKILGMIENVRSTIYNMDETNRAHSAKYILNLSKLSEMYVNLV